MKPAHLLYMKKIEQDLVTLIAALSPYNAREGKYVKVPHTLALFVLLLRSKNTSSRIAGWSRGGEILSASFLCPLGKYRARRGLRPSPRHRQNRILPINATSR